MIDWSKDQAERIDSRLWLGSDIFELMISKVIARSRGWLTDMQQQRVEKRKLGN